VEVIGPGYVKWIYGSPEAENLIKGNASDWARLAVRRTTPDKTRLKATGDAAERALELVKAYI
jgi:hypothetical protein